MLSEKLIPLKTVWFFLQKTSRHYCNIEILEKFLVHWWPCGLPSVGHAFLLVWNVWLSGQLICFIFSIWLISLRRVFLIHKGQLYWWPAVGLCFSQSIDCCWWYEQFCRSNSDLYSLIKLLRVILSREPSSSERESFESNCYMVTCSNIGRIWIGITISADRSRKAIFYPEKSQHQLHQKLTIVEIHNCFTILLKLFQTWTTPV